MFQCLATVCMLRVQQSVYHSVIFDSTDQTPSADDNCEILLKAPEKARNADGFNIII